MLGLNGTPTGVWVRPIFTSDGMLGSEGLEVLEVDPLPNGFWWIKMRTAISLIGSKVMSKTRRVC